MCAERHHASICVQLGDDRLLETPCVCRCRAVTAAGLVDTLSGEGPFTVFAPTDDAFAALPEGTLEGLLNDIPTLTSILTYHVVPGAVMSGDLSDGMMPATVNGQTVTIGVGDGVTVDGANVIIADIEASNGVIHVIDSVILPE